ncbi:MAG: cytochrome c biogenesis protein ResB [Nitrospirota bacterium]|nr:cytochrome c biogenesis protein ResB [Nitrospirota bacterium]
MKNFFLSLKTTVWTLFGLICIFFLGSYLMPAHRDVHGSMNDQLLFQWVSETAVLHPWAASWFFLSLAGLALLTVNTVVCSVQAIRGKWSRADFLLRMAPQIVHIGFLCILLAHFLGAGWGYRLAGSLPVEMSARLPDDRVLFLNDLRPQIDSRGSLTGWAAEVVIFENGQRVAEGVLGPNEPLFYKGMGVYLKSFDLQDRPIAHLMVNRDPGAFWALFGSALFIVGATMILLLKWNRA